MPDADGNHPALDARVRLGPFDPGRKPVHIGPVGETGGLGVVRRNEHLTIDRAFGGEHPEIGLGQQAVVGRRLEDRTRQIVGLQKRREIGPDVFAVLVDDRGNVDALLLGQPAHQRRRRGPLDVAVKFGLRHSLIGCHALSLAGICAKVLTGGRPVPASGIRTPASACPVPASASCPPTIPPRRPA